MMNNKVEGFDNFWVTFKFCLVDSILLVHIYNKRGVQSLSTLEGNLLVPGSNQLNICEDNGFLNMISKGTSLERRKDSRR